MTVTLTFSESEVLTLACSLMIAGAQYADDSAHVKLLRALGFRAGRETIDDLRSLAERRSSHGYVEVEEGRA